MNAQILTFPAMQTGRKSQLTGQIESGTVSSISDRKVMTNECNHAKKGLDAFPVGIVALRRFIKDMYLGLAEISATNLADRHRRIQDAWHIGIPVGTPGKTDEKAILRKHEREFFSNCLGLGVPPARVGEAMVLRGSSKADINASFLGIADWIEGATWPGYAAFEGILAAS